ncbi:NACHT, LRR and PYD domains-containing protein 3 [Sarcophilus harrisii]|uniref:NLR family pyrin domain containing 12 n=1 Tax=Sarcophilus harrisii TaxID=9305 RepID=G3VWR1_SARHA|nr:NACHT, LRR and PYD domains-containing protein 3 [Sarcophilus harrisii]
MAQVPWGGFQNWIKEGGAGARSWGRTERSPLAEGVRCQLARHLEDLTPDELKKFKLYLKDHSSGLGIPRGRVDGVDSTEMAEILVSSRGEQEAWQLALSIWKKMGLRELWEQASKEGPRLKTIPGNKKKHEGEDERNKYRERMRKKFQLMRDRNSRPGEHELFHHRFTELLLLRGYRYKEQKHHELLVHGWEHATVMQERGQLTRVSTLFDPDQKIGIPPHTVVLQGAAGIGKTTLASKVMLDWAEGNFFQERFNYVFYLTCRELNPLEGKIISFADLIANDWPGPQAPMTEIMSQPERLLFIIDGLDELKFPCNEHRYDLCKDWKQQRPVPILLSSLLRKTLLPEACLLLTTRLTALGKFSPLLESPRHVEILGFSVQHREEYFCKFFRDKDLGEKIFHLVKGNGTLLTMCSVPLMNWIVCTCLKQQMEKGQEPVQALKTTTALYMCYLSNLIIPDDKNFIPQHLRGLCRLAAEGIWDRKLLFEEEDLRRNTLETADVSAFLDMNIFQKDSGCENCYSFIHLSFQEFFAAMFYVMSTEEEGMKSSDSFIPGVRELLEECSGFNASFVVLVVRFLFGFLNVETARELERKFRCRMSPEIKSQLLQWAQGESRRNYKRSQFSDIYFPEWYSHLYETQDAEFVTQVLVNIQEINVDIVYPSDALSAVFCIKQCHGAQRLFFSYDSDLPACVWQDLYSVVSKNHNLKNLKLCCRDFYDSCIEDLCMEIKHPDCQLENLFLELRNPNCKLEKLTLEHFKVAYSCCQYLFSALSLKSLHFKRIFFEDDGMKLPCETLGKKNCQLQSLKISHCQGFGVNILDFFSAFVNNESLRILELSFICLKEDEVKLLCNVLTKQDCKLHALSLRSCDLTTTGYQNLFSALSSNMSLKNLDLSRNSFEETEIKSLCKTLENQNCKLEKLRLTYCKLSPASCCCLSSNLMKNESLKDLCLSRNCVGDCAVKLLCKALGNQNCKLHTLRLSGCNLTATCLQDILSVICSSDKLKKLDLSRNYFGDEGMKLLCEALQKQDCKLQRLNLSRCPLSEESERAWTSLNSRKSFHITWKDYYAATKESFDWDAEDTV